MGQLVAHKIRVDIVPPNEGNRVISNTTEGPELDGLIAACWQQRNKTTEMGLQNGFSRSDNKSKVTTASSTSILVNG